MGKELKCHKCGYRWEYNGDKKYKTRCPDCFSIVYVADNATQRSFSFYPLKCPRCDYQWRYKGKRKNKILCPGCLKYFSVILGPPLEESKDINITNDTPTIGDINDEGKKS